MPSERGRRESANGFAGEGARGTNMREAGVSKHGRREVADRLLLTLAQFLGSPDGSKSMTPLTLAFMGSPELAVPSLAALIAAGHRIAMVYAQPPRPAGRGHRSAALRRACFRQAQGLPVRTPASLRDPAEQESFAALRVDAAVVVAYGLILPPAILEARHGWARSMFISPCCRAGAVRRRCSGRSWPGMPKPASPSWRWMRGSIPDRSCCRRAVAIAARETAPELGRRLADLGARLLVQAIHGLASGRLVSRPQPAKGVTVAPKLRREEGRLDWRRPAVELDRQVRAFLPWPGAWFDTADGERIKVLAAEPAAGTGEPGSVIGPGLTVACGEGALRLTRVQRSGPGGDER